LSSPGRCGSPIPGSTPLRTWRRRRCSSGLNPVTSHSCGSLAARSYGGRAMGSCRGHSGSGWSWRPARRSISLSSAVAGGSRRGCLRRLGGPRHTGDGEHRPRWPGGNLTADRELPRLSGGHQRHRTDQPRGHPGAEVRCPRGDALPYLSPTAASSRQASGAGT
jgi:hypothetical protein